MNKRIQNSRSLRTMLMTVTAFLMLHSGISAKESPPRGVVAADHPQAAAVGVRLLEMGGDAADAAVGTALALGVVHPFASGIGGGGFAISTRTTGEMLALDFRETAPQKATQDMFLNRDGEVRAKASTHGALAVAIPGELAGLWALHQKYGKLPWHVVVQPAVDLAREGFLVSKILEKKIKSSKSSLHRVPHAANFFTKNGEPVSAGQTVVSPLLGNTLSLIGEKGIHVFYRGKVGKSIVNTIQKQGGIMTMDDLKSYRVRERKPLVDRFQEFEVVTMPPPSSGGVVLLQTLKVIAQSLPQSTDRSHPEYTHRLIESLKHGFADRAKNMGDPDFVPFNIPSFLSETRIDQIISDYDPQKTHPPGHYGEKKSVGTDGGTSHLSVLDSAGNAVSLTTTINTGFGSEVITDMGIVLNNQMDDFVSRPGVPNFFGLIGTRANAIAPGKRPLSSMSPTILRKNNRAMVVVGASGGPTIITSTIQTILNLIRFGLSPKAAVEASRVHHQWQPDLIYIEPSTKESQRLALREKGHTLKVRERFSAVQVISTLNGLAEGAADPSKGGAAYTTVERSP